MKIYTVYRLREDRCEFIYHGDNFLMARFAYIDNPNTFTSFEWKPWMYCI